MESVPKLNWNVIMSTSQDMLDNATQELLTSLLYTKFTTDQIDTLPPHYTLHFISLLQCLCIRYMEEARNCQANENMLNVERYSNQNMIDKIKKLKSENNKLQREVYTTSKLTDEYEEIIQRLKLQNKAMKSKNHDLSQAAKKTNIDNERVNRKIDDLRSHMETLFYMYGIGNTFYPQYIPQPQPEPEPEPEYEPEPVPVRKGGKIKLNRNYSRSMSRKFSEDGY